MRKTFTGSIATALTAAIIATSFTVTQVSAASAPVAAKAATSDFSARRWHRGGNAAVAFGAMALIAGAAIAASQRDDYCGPYGCNYAYAPAPYPYSGYGYYGGYRGHHWHHHWR